MHCGFLIFPLKVSPMGRVRGRKWMQEHVADVYVKKARAEGARSRAAYKLEQLAERDRLLAPGMTVVDLGAAPGGWSKVAAAGVGPQGRVLALDLLEMASLPGVTFIRGDFGDDAVAGKLAEALHGAKADLVLSDMAPNVSGIASVDQARVLALAELALDFALKHLKPQGNLVVKLFHGAAFESFLKQMRAHFSAVAARKPDASRDRSSEVYLVGKGLRR
jgi:23S rRNA (uridine2552-2'-O)-methyltransferase